MDGATSGLAMNVVVCAAGRRTSLVKAFVEAVHDRGGRLLASDVDPLAPALFLADEALRTPRTDDPGFLDAMLALVAEHDVRLLIPTIDTDLRLLAANRATFAALGCLVAISAESFVTTTMDKHDTGETFGAAGIRVPSSWLPPIDSTDTLPPRVFVKPRRGSASRDIHEVARSDLDSILGLVTDPIVQELLTGPEITIDAFLDLDGRPIHYVPRRRIRTLAGESVQGVTLDHESALEAWIEGVLGLCSRLGAAGPMTLQAFLMPDGPVLTEINPRFAGGFPLALAAGADYPAWLLDLADGQPIEARLGEWEAGLYMTRYHVELFTRHPKW